MVDVPLNSMFDLSTDCNHMKASRVRRCIEAGIHTLPDNHVRECLAICNQLWFEIFTDVRDTWQFYPHEMITEAQVLWENRLKLFEEECLRRNLDSDPI